MWPLRWHWRWPRRHQGARLSSRWGPGSVLLGASCDWEPLCSLCPVGSSRTPPAWAARDVGACVCENHCHFGEDPLTA